MRRAVCAVAIVAGCAGGSAAPPVQVVAIDTPPPAPSASASAEPEPERARAPSKCSDGPCGNAAELKSTYVIGNGPRALSSARGPVVIVFCATFAEPCKKMIPFYQASLKKDGRKAALIVVMEDEDDQSARSMVTAFARDAGTEPAYLIDKGNVDAKAYNLTTLPTAILVDHDGKIRHVVQGFSTEGTDALQRALERL